MSHFDELFGDADNQNEGEIHSDDEAGDADDLENNHNDEGDSRAVKVEPKKKIVRNPRLTLNVALLCGPRGINDLENYYKNMKFRGKGYEKEDLDAVMKRMQHWAHRMFPKYGLDDSLAAIENLGRKKEMQSYMNKYRMGLLETEATKDADDYYDKMAYESNILDQPLDPLDSMLDEQIAISRAGTNFNTSGITNLSVSEKNFDTLKSIDTLSSTSTNKRSSGLSEEMRAKIEANRQKALEIRRAKIAAAAAQAPNSTSENILGNHENPKQSSIA